MTEQVYETKQSNFKYIWIGLIIIALIGGVIVVFSTTTGNTDIADSTQNSGASDLPPAPIAGHPVPDFTLQNVDGETVSLSDFHGQPVIINFWATWCGPCRVEMPEFQEAFTEHQQDGLIILGVNLTERDSVEAVPGFLDEFGLTFPVVLDADGDVAEAYNVFGQPASVFVNKDGTVHELFYGPVNKTFIDERVEQLLES